MWNMPSMVTPAMVAFTCPDCQKPPRSVWLVTLPVDFPPGPSGVAGMVPPQGQLPPKNASCDISAGGFGGPSWASAGAAQRAATIAAAKSERVVMSSSLDPAGPPADRLRWTCRIDSVLSHAGRADKGP